jgi:hypothetical protein
MEDAIGRPLRLKDGFRRAISNMLSLPNVTVGGKLTHPQFRAIPWHVGVIPREPGKTRTVRA